MRLPRRPALTRLPLREPWAVLVPLVLAQWIALAVLVASIRHNAWLFYQGGDQTFFYTSSWTIAGGHIPEAAIGYAWPYLLSPVALVSGANYLAALPVLVLLQAAVLLPVALYCVYAIGARIGGRLLGYVVAAAWVTVPFAAIPLWDGRYHGKYVEQFLPQALGLTGLGDFPSMVCLLVAALFCLRALDTADPVDGVLAGLAAGFAVGIKPANALFLAGPLLAFAAARRLREGVAFVLALAPAVLALALWKYRGLGNLPVLTPSPHAAALGNGFVSPPSGVVAGRYLDLDWSRLRDNYVQLRDVFWGVPILQSLPILGFIAVARSAWPKALLLGGWLAAFILVKGTSDVANVESGTLLRLFMPGFPPLLLLAALVPLLLPVFRRRPAQKDATPIGRRTTAAALAVFGVLPLLLFMVLSPLHDDTAVKYFDESVIVPVDESFPIQVRRMGRQAVLSWQPPASAGDAVFFRVFRSRPVVSAPDPTLPPGHDGIRCAERKPSGWTRAADCSLEMSVVGTTRSTRFADAVSAGPWVYRVGLAANWRDDPSGGDVMLLSDAARLGG